MRLLLFPGTSSEAERRESQGADKGRDYARSPELKPSAPGVH